MTDPVVVTCQNYSKLIKYIVRKCTQSGLRTIKLTGRNSKFRASIIYAICGALLVGNSELIDLLNQKFIFKYDFTSHFSEFFPSICNYVDSKHIIHIFTQYQILAREYCCDIEKINGYGDMIVEDLKRPDHCLQHDCPVRGYYLRTVCEGFGSDSNLLSFQRAIQITTLEFQFQLICSYAAGLLYGNKLDQLVKFHNNYPFDYSDIDVKMSRLLDNNVSIQVINFCLKNSISQSIISSSYKILERSNIKFNLMKYCIRYVFDHNNGQITHNHFLLCQKFIKYGYVKQNSKYLALIQLFSSRRFSQCKTENHGVVNIICKLFSNKHIHLTELSYFIDHGHITFEQLDKYLLTNQRGLSVRKQKNMM